MYDGDTPGAARRTIRARAHIVATNPDMLHRAILPHHTKWAKLFENLRFIVIDEMHTYRGVFGSHFTNLLRRLRRVCRHYGSDPQCILSSATIRNPRSSPRVSPSGRCRWWIGAGLPDPSGSSSSTTPRW